MRDKLKEHLLAKKYSEIKASKKKDSEQFFLILKEIFYGNYIDKQLQKEHKLLVQNTIGFINSLFGDSEILSFLRKLVQEGDELAAETWELIKQALTEYLEHKEYYKVSDKIQKEIEIGKNNLLANRRFGAGLVATRGRVELLLSHEEPLVRAIAVKYLARKQKTPTQMLEFLFRLTDTSDEIINRTAKDLLVKLYQPDNEREFRAFLDNPEKVQKFLDDIQSDAEKKFIRNSKKLSEPEFVVECICEQLKETKEEVFLKIDTLKSTLGYTKDDYTIPVLLAQEFNVEIGDPDKYLYIQLGVAIQTKESTRYLQIYPLTTIDKKKMIDLFIFRGFYDDIAANNGIVIKNIPSEYMDEESKKHFPILKLKSDDFPINRIINTSIVINKYFGDPIIYDKQKNRKYMPYTLMSSFEYETRKLDDEIQFEYISLDCLRNNSTVRELDFQERKVLEIIDWEVLSFCPRLTSISINESPISDERLYIDISTDMVLPRLENITIYGTTLEKVDLRFLKNSPCLTRLDITNKYHVNKAYVFNEILLPPLTDHQDFLEARFSSKVFDASILANCHSLKDLDLSVDNPCDLSPLQSCEGLERLVLYIGENTKVSDLEGIVNLKKLIIENNSPNWEINIPFLPALQELHVTSNGGIKSINLNEIGDKCPSLIEFRLKDSKSKFDLSPLQGHPSLRKLLGNGKWQEVKWWENKGITNRVWEEFLSVNDEMDVWDRINAINKITKIPGWWQRKEAMARMKKGFNDPNVNMRQTCAMVLEKIPDWWERQELFERVLQDVSGDLSFDYSVKLLTQVPYWWENEQIYQIILTRLKDPKFNLRYVPAQLLMSIPNWMDNQDIISVLFGRFDDLPDKKYIFDILEDFSSWENNRDLISLILNKGDELASIYKFKMIIQEKFLEIPKWEEEEFAFELIRDLIKPSGFILIDNKGVLFPIHQRGKGRFIINFTSSGISIHEYESGKVYQEYLWREFSTALETEVSSSDNGPIMCIQYVFGKMLIKVAFSDYIGCENWAKWVGTIQYFLQNYQRGIYFHERKKISSPLRNITIFLPNQIDSLELSQTEKEVLLQSGFTQIVNWWSKDIERIRETSVHIMDHHLTKIDWRNKPVPNMINVFEELSELYIKGEEIVNLPTTIGDLKKLTHLYIEATSISHLPEELGNLTNLVTLTIKSSPLTSLPLGIKKLKKLKNLLINKTSLSHLPEELGNLTNLETLYLSSSPLTSLPKELGVLKNLKILSLGGNSIDQIPSELGNLTRLESLSISNTSLCSLPVPIGNLKRLTTLSLNNNSSLIKLPDSIGDLHQLRKLYLVKNKFVTLPETIGKLKLLRKIFLTENNIEILPDSFGDLENLVEVVICEKLKNLPDSLGKLKNLEEFSLKGSDLNNLPTSIGQLVNLKYLNLMENSLVNLPDSIGQLVSLEKLKLWKNNITSLPETIGSLTNLRELSIGRNNLKKLPKSIGQLANIREIYVYENELTCLPSTIGDLPHLRRLGASHNPLKGIPQKIANLQLEYFKVDEDTKVLYEE